MPKSEYQQRKAAEQCGRAGCKTKPKLGKDGKRRSYCPVHNAENRKNMEDSPFILPERCYNPSLALLRCNDRRISHLA